MRSLLRNVVSVCLVLSAFGQIFGAKRGARQPSIACKDHPSEARHGAGMAGLSIAMGNASSDVRRQAKFVTTSNEEEGFANAIRA